MQIAIISTRGIPNSYGGFEQFAEYISVGLVNKGHDITVYSPHYHSYKKKIYKNVKIKHIYSPEKILGNSFGSFIYDFLSFRDALKRSKYDIILVCGYTSIIPAFLFYRINKYKRKPIIVTNMDGLEHKRSKFNKLVRKFIMIEEKIAINYSEYLVSDNIGIKEYIGQNYGKESEFIPYGAEIIQQFSQDSLKKFDLKENNYYLVIARIEPENNIDMIIEGYINSCHKKESPLVIIGNKDTKYCKYLLEKYKNKEVLFLGGVYDYKILNDLRYFSIMYFHGHSVGGTNPSLLEAMASRSFIIAHDNIFNKSVLGNNGLYFKDSFMIKKIINKHDNIDFSLKLKMIEKNIDRLSTNYSWSHIIDSYNSYFLRIFRH